MSIFDEWPQFSDTTRFGNKGCDVVALDGEDLWLIEMKDYTYPGAGAPGNLHDKIGLKAAGTMAVLFAQARTHQDSAAKDFALSCAGVKRIHLALHIQPKTGGRPQRYHAPLLQPHLDKLKQISRALGLHKAHVTSTLSPHANTPWSAYRDPADRARHTDRQ